MRFCQLLVAAAVSVSVTIAKKAPSAYDVYQKKQSPVLLNEQSYDEITSAPRDYHAAIVLTALDAKFACGICRDFDPEWDVIAKSWQKGDKKGEHRMLFGKLDFEQGKSVFMKVGTQLIRNDQKLINRSTNYRQHQYCSSSLQPQGQMLRQTGSRLGSISWVLRQLKAFMAGYNDTYHLVAILNLFDLSTGADLLQQLPY